MISAEAEAIAAAIIAASDGARSIPPISRSRPDFALADAYQVAAAVAARRVARGERRVGWKIGFTNRTIWDEYDVHAPIWGPVYDTTVRTVGPGAPVPCALAPLVEPRIEPEIVFRFAAPPEPGMDETALLGCIDGVAHGFEIVQSLFPGWKFTAADTIAAFALHGRLLCGPFAPMPDAAARSRWFEALERFEIALSRNGQEVDRGQGRNVLDGPLHALNHFIRGLASMSGERIRAGDIVTTGTVTRAFPVGPGEHWSSALVGLPLPGLAVTFG